MPQQSSQSLLDGAATPVAHVFSPQGVLSEKGEVVATYLNRGASSLTSGAERLVIYTKAKRDGSLGYRQSLIIPITEAVAGVNVVTRSLRVTVTFEVPSNSTAQDVKNLRRLAWNSLADGTNLSAALDAREGVF